MAQGEKIIGKMSMELLLKTIHGEERPGTVMAPYRIIKRYERNWGL